MCGVRVCELRKVTAFNELPTDGVWKKTFYWFIV